LPVEDDRFAIVKQARWHGIDLRSEVDALWRGIHDTSKRAIQKALRSGVVVHLAQELDEVRVFYDMHLKLRKYKYGLLAQPFAFFGSIWREFVEHQRGALLVATCEDRIVGGVVLLEWGGTVYYKFNASAPEELG